MYCPLIQSPRCQQHLGTQSLMGVEGPQISVSSQDTHQQETTSEAEPGLEPRYSDMGCRHPQQRLNPCAKCQSRMFLEASRIIQSSI